MLGPGLELESAFDAEAEEPEPNPEEPVDEPIAADEDPDELTVLAMLAREFKLLLPETSRLLAATPRDVAAN